MVALRQIVTQKGSEYEWEEIDAEHLVGMVGDLPVVIRAVLERTAVVHPIRDDSPDARRVIKLEFVNVWSRDIKWKPRPEADTWNTIDYRRRLVARN